MRRILELTGTDTYGTPLTTNRRMTFTLIGYSKFATVSAYMSDIYTRPDVFPIELTLFSHLELFRTGSFVEQDISELQAAREMKNQAR